jgi:hypothetical protein
VPAVFRRDEGEGLEKQNALAGRPGGRKPAPKKANSLFPAVSVVARSKRHGQYAIEEEKAKIFERKWNGCSSIQVLEFPLFEIRRRGFPKISFPVK